MKKYTTTTVLKVAHVCGLTEDQAALRAHNLQECEDQPSGLPKDRIAYTPINPIQFKAGETVYLESIPKADLASVGLVDTVEAEKQAKKDRDELVKELADQDEARKARAKKQAKKKASKK